MANWTEMQEHSEGRVARSIEQQTAKLPSDTFLWAAVGAMAASAALQISGRQLRAADIALRSALGPVACECARTQP